MRQVPLFFNVKTINKCYKVLNEIIENPCNPNNTVLIYKKIETRYCKSITKKTNEADGQIRCIKLESDCEGEQS